MRLPLRDLGALGLMRVSTGWRALRVGDGGALGRSAAGGQEGGLAGLGVQSLAGFGIHSKFSALCGQCNAVDPKGSWGGDTAGASGVLDTDPGSPHPGPRPTWGRVTETWLMGGIWGSNTVSPQDPETKRPLTAQAVRLCPCRGDGEAGVDTGQWSLHTAAVVAQDLALFTEVLRVLLALVRHVQAVGLLQGSLQGWGGGAGEGETEKQRREA